MARDPPRDAKGKFVSAANKVPLPAANGSDDGKTGNTAAAVLATEQEAVDTGLLPTDSDVTGAQRGENAGLSTDTDASKGDKLAKLHAEVKQATVSTMAHKAGSVMQDLESTGSESERVELSQKLEDLSRAQLQDRFATASSLQSIMRALADLSTQMHDVQIAQVRMATHVRSEGSQAGSREGSQADAEAAAQQALMAQAAANTQQRAKELQLAQQQFEKAQRAMVAAEDEELALSLNSEVGSSPRLTAANLDALEQSSSVSAFTPKLGKAQLRREKAAAEKQRQSEMKAQAAAKELAEQQALSAAVVQARAEREAREQRLADERRRVQQAVMAQQRVQAEADAVGQRAPFAGTVGAWGQTQHKPVLHDLGKEDLNAMFPFPPASAYRDGGSLEDAATWLASTLHSLQDAVLAKAQQQHAKSTTIYEEPSWENMQLRWATPAVKALMVKVNSEEKAEAQLSPHCTQLSRSSIVTMLHTLKESAVAMERSGASDMHILAHIKREFMCHFTDRDPGEYNLDIVTLTVQPGTPLRAAFAALEKKVNVARHVQLEVDREGLLDGQRKISISRWAYRYFPNLAVPMKAAHSAPGSTTDSLMAVIRANLHITMRAEDPTLLTGVGTVTPVAAASSTTSAATRSVVSSINAVNTVSASAPSARQLEKLRQASDLLAFHVSDSTICFNCDKGGHMWGECPEHYNSSLLNDKYNRKVSQDAFEKVRTQIRSARSTVKSSGNYNSNRQHQYNNRRRSGAPTSRSG